VVLTRVGYAGGTTKDPTYYNLGDHTEAVQIDYDPTQVSYQELLDAFWAGHNPTAPSFSRQYMSILFFHSEEQKELATEARDREAARRQTSIYTEIVPASQFHLAEGYHQKYYLRQVPELMREFRLIYPEEADLVASTAAARANGYLGGHDTLAALREELGELGFSAEAGDRLLEMVQASGR